MSDQVIYEHKAFGLHVVVARRSSLLGDRDCHLGKVTGYGVNYTVTHDPTPYGLSAIYHGMLNVLRRQHQTLTDRRIRSEFQTACDGIYRLAIKRQNARQAEWPYYGWRPLDESAPCPMDDSGETETGRDDE
jgi:hypothetical protein